MDKILQYFINWDALFFHNIICFFQISFSYFVICVLLPSFFLHRHLKNKGLFFRLLAYQVSANIYINLVCFALAYLKLFSFFSVLIFFVLLPISTLIYINIKMLTLKFKNAYIVIIDVIHGTYGKKIIARNIRKFFANLDQLFYNKFLKGRRLECALFCLTLLYLVMFYGYSRFFAPAYGHTDEETHIFWINSIVQNNAFPKGLYPHGMHFLTASLSTLFGISLDFSSLAFSILSSSLIFITVYAIMKELFTAKYATLFAWILVMVTNAFDVSAYFRFQYIFPMEFSLLPVLIAVFALVHTIKYSDKFSFYLFALSLAWSVYAHFYGTIFLAFICLAFGIVFLVKLIKTKMIFKYLIYGSAGVFLGIFPFLIGFLSGIEFERSIAWALGVMSSNEDLISQGLNPNSSGEALAEAQGGFVLSELPDYLASSTFSSGILSMFAVALVLFIFIYSIVGIFTHKRNQKQLPIYLFFSVTYIIMLILSIAPKLNLPAIIHTNRVSVFIFLLSPILVAIVFNLAHDMLAVVVKTKETLSLTTLLIGLSLTASVFLTNGEKEDLLFTKIVSNGDGALAIDLIKNSPKNTYTVVSTTNILSILTGNGYHVEILDLLEASENKEDFYIPTQDVYIVLETRANIFGERLIDLTHETDYEYSVPISLSSAMNNDVDIFTAYGDSRDRAYYFNRPTIMSRLHFLILELESVYPNEVSIYYEDDFNTIYKIEQDPYFLLNMAVDYSIYFPEVLDVQ